MAAADVAEKAAETWFLGHGLPYFVDEVRTDVRRRLHRSRVVVVVLVSLAVGVAVGVLSGLVADSGDDASVGFTAGWVVALAMVSLYALRSLQAAAIARWAAGRAFASLGLLVPLVTRALPMLLLFVTFFFLSTELWQVADRLSWGVLGGTVLFFGAAAVFFLVARLGEELDDVDDIVDTEEVVQGCTGTPLEKAAREIAAQRADLGVDTHVVGLERANLVLALVIAQAVQVLLLSVAVTVFFIVFGVVAIEEPVIVTWIGHDPSYLLVDNLVSTQLAKVSIFLGSFSGLYFTVYAVTDATYRQQFFTEILRELERAVGVRAVYRHLRDVPEDSPTITGGGTPAPPAPAG